MTLKLSLLGRFLDWYTSGQITAAVTANGRAEHWKGIALKSQSQFHAMSKQFDTACEIADEQRAMLKRGVEGMTKYERALEAIIALETPSMAHVGKRAVKIAREALEK